MLNIAPKPTLESEATANFSQRTLCVRELSADAK